MKWRSISSVTSKSAITPSLSGRIAEIVPGVRPSMRLASIPTACTSPVRASIADDAGLREHDAASAHVHERVGRAEVHGHVAAAEPSHIAEETHRWGVGADVPRLPSDAL